MSNTKDTPMDDKQFEGHTPGPWELWTRDSYTMQLKANEKNIAIIRSDVDRLLIASSPDLLKENQELKLELQKQKELNAELVKEVEQLIIHAEEDSLNYSVLEHARKLVFKITHPDEYDRYQKAE